MIAPTAAHASPPPHAAIHIAEEKDERDGAQAVDPAEANWQPVLFPSPSPSSPPPRPCLSSSSSSAGPVGVAAALTVALPTAHPTPSAASWTLTAASASPSAIGENEQGAEWHRQDAPQHVANQKVTTTAAVAASATGAAVPQSSSAAPAQAQPVLVTPVTPPLRARPFAGGLIGSVMGRRQPTLEKEKADTNSHSGPRAPASRPRGCSCAHFIRGARRIFCARWSFALLFSVLTTVILIALVAVVWLSGVASTKSIVRRMAATTRDALMETATQQVSQRFSHSLDSLLMLRYSAMGIFPNFATDRQLSHQPGWLAIVTAVAGVSAQLRSLGVLNQSQQTHAQSIGRQWA